MNSTTTALSSAEQTNLNTLLCALPEQYTTIDWNTYRTFRPIIMAAIPFIGMVPGLGSKVASAIQFLIQIADSVCPPQGQQVNPSTGSADTSGFDLLKASGILNPNVTLDQLIGLQQKLSALPNDGDIIHIQVFSKLAR